MMEDAGQRLRRIRERLGLRYRDVEEQSQRIADRHKNNEYVIALSRLADIENRGTVPTIFKLYSLCCIYRQDLGEVMRWYGVNPALLPSEAMLLGHEQTHPADFQPVGDEGGLSGDLVVPMTLDPGFDLHKTAFVSRLIQKWGTLPLMQLRGLDVPTHRYGYIGLDDNSMAPLLLPGAFVLIDESARRVAESGWSSEFTRPIYFLELREGWRVAWCSLVGEHIILQPHPSSGRHVEVYPAQTVDVVGQVVGVAMHLGADARRIRS